MKMVHLKNSENDINFEIGQDLTVVEAIGSKPRDRIGTPASRQPNKQNDSIINRSSQRHSARMIKTIGGRGSTSGSRKRNDCSALVKQKDAALNPSDKNMSSKRLAADEDISSLQASVTPMPVKNRRCAHVWKDDELEFTPDTPNTSEIRWMREEDRIVLKQIKDHSYENVAEFAHLLPNKTQNNIRDRVHF